MSHEGSPNKYMRSSRVVHKYYRRLIAQIADRVLERESEFANPFLGQAEGFLERNSRLLYDVATVYTNLKRFASPDRDDASLRVKELAVAEGSLESAINGWLADNPGCFPMSFSVVQQADRPVVLILYQESGGG